MWMANPYILYDYVILMFSSLYSCWKVQGVTVSIVLTGGAYRGLNSGGRTGEAKSSWCHLVGVELNGVPRPW